MTPSSGPDVGRLRELRGLPLHHFIPTSLHPCLVSWTCILVTIFCSAASLAESEAATTAPPEQQARPIQFATFEEALRRGAERNQVTVVYFTADWCGWCRKMHSTTFADPRVQALATKFSWAKVDTDDVPHLAATFAVRGLPTIAMLNVKGEILAKQSGFIPPDRMTEMLRTFVDKAGVPGRARQQRANMARRAEKLKHLAAGEAGDQVLVEAVETLAQSDRRDRSALIQGILEAGPRAWPALLGRMSDERLAVRAAAHDLLSDSTGAQLPFDPFAPLENRPRQLASWMQWIESHPTGTGS